MKKVEMEPSINVLEKEQEAANTLWFRFIS